MWRKNEQPLRGNYRGYEVISMPPPSSGGAVLIEMLNILEGFDLRKFDAASSERYHLMTEAMRRAFADRAEYMGDTDFVKVPVAGLIDKSYAAKLRASINTDRASTSEEVQRRPTGRATNLKRRRTSRSSTPKEMPSNTYTLNNSYGSAAVAKGTGIILNDEMDDFAAKPGTPNMYGLIQGERNAVAPRKRPLSAMTPTFVLAQRWQSLVYGRQSGRANDHQHGALRYHERGRLRHEHPAGDRLPAHSSSVAAGRAGV